MAARLLRFLVGFGLLSLIAFAGTSGSDGADAASTTTRTFRFTYGATITGLRPGDKARIWLPIPRSNRDQEVSIIGKSYQADTARMTVEPKYGNRILYLEAAADANGSIPVQISYRVRRREVKAGRREEADDMAALALFLRPARRIPVGHEKPLALLANRTLPKDDYGVGRVLYDVVAEHMRYSKEGRGWGKGDALWACDSRYGNCTDFHSLFIALARSMNIPARFEIGFLLPVERGRGTVPGYHCWAQFKPKGNGWVPVDISEADKHPSLKEYYFGNLTADRVTFTIGRDLTLVPRQAGPPLNFFVYPYAEVDGQPVADGNIRKRFTYEDLNSDQ